MMQAPGWFIDTNASHFDNFDQPKQVADAINNYVHSFSLGGKINQ